MITSSQAGLVRLRVLCMNVNGAKRVSQLRLQKRAIFKLIKQQNRLHTKGKQSHENNRAQQATEVR